MTATVRPECGEHPGSRPGEVEEEVRLLDPGTASRGTRSGEGSLGRDGGERGSQHLGEGATAHVGNQFGEPIKLADPPDAFLGSDLPYAVDSAGGTITLLSCEVLYDRIPDAVLGTSFPHDEDTSEDRSRARCFNCGSVEHALNNCPDPRNVALIALSKQYYYFYRSKAASSDLTLGDLAQAQNWRETRLAWVDAFNPGSVRGEELRDALGLEEGDRGKRVPWLEHMTEWGYPRGWTGSRNPKDLMRERIMLDSNDRDDELEEESEFIIFGDDEPEHIDLQSLLLPSPAPHGTISKRSRTLSLASASSSATSATLSEDDAPDFPTSHRWAIYPNTYFSPAFLTLYHGRPLSTSPDSLVPSGWRFPGTLSIVELHAWAEDMEAHALAWGPTATVAVEHASATFTHDRQALWQRILAEGTAEPSGRGATAPSHPATVPPWRQPAAFGVPLGASSAIIKPVNFSPIVQHLPTLHFSAAPALASALPHTNGPSSLTPQTVASFQHATPPPPPTATPPPLPSSSAAAVSLGDPDSTDELVDMDVSDSDQD